MKCFSSRGKLLLSGEYFLLEGATGLALPCRFYQHLKISERASMGVGVLEWKSFDETDHAQSRVPWFETTFHLADFEKLVLCPWKEIASTGERELFLLQIFKAIFELGPNFYQQLRQELLRHQSFLAEATLEFGKNWGLGSSSTLISNLAQWAEISPMELFFHLKKQGVVHGSGYDVACAQAYGPILYQVDGFQKNVELYRPLWEKHVGLLYLGKKQSTEKEIALFAEHAMSEDQKKVLRERISEISLGLVEAKTYQQLNALLEEHVKLVAGALDKRPIKDQFFPDYWGQVRPLGAWGGDFALVTTDQPWDEVCSYFKSKGHEILLPFSEMAL